MVYYFTKIVNLKFEETLEKVVGELKKHGFGVLTEIDVKATLKKKLDVDFRRYKILGTCNPPFAYEALKNERLIGLMLPCNVVVQETENGQTEVSAIDPLASMQAIENPGLESTARKVQGELKSVIDHL